MQMNSTPQYSRRLVVWVALIALGLRSLIPAGFMPDFSGHAGGLFALTICDGIHHQHHSHGGTTHDHTDVCPFSVGAIYGFDGIKIPLVLPPVFALTANAPHLPLFFRQYAVFSNASPRSPPPFS